MKKFILTTLSITAIAFLSNSSVSAASGFNAGNIMDDAVFTNKSSMSVSQIQTFLNSKVHTCDTNGQQLSEFGGPDLNGDGKVQRWEWGKQNYNQTTFPCLRDYKQNDKSAAQLIHDASQKYSINPQVLIVLLQKEQGLVTDTWPLNMQYRSATGYGCPDTAACDSKYYGLTNQLNWAATMFRAIMDNSPTWYTPYELGNNYIQYNPNSSCGGSTVDIKNRTTQALYNYTPYQPNKAAIDAGWGTVNCGAYGNRNFYLYFTSWFGSTQDTYSYRFERLVGASPSVISTTNPSLGSYTKTLVNGKEIYVFYYDETSKNLRYALWNGSKWSNHILDGPGSSVAGATANDVGKGIDAVVWNGQIQVYYTDVTNGDLRHGWKSSNGWRTEALDGSTSSISMQNSDTGVSPKVLVYNGNLQVYYHDKTNGSLRHSWWSDGKWKFETMDGLTGSLSKYDANVGSEIDALVYNGGLQLYYYNKTNGSVRHAWWGNDKKWNFETLDGTAGSLGNATGDIGTSISATLYNGKLQLYYHDKTNGELKHAWWANNKWNFEIMDGNDKSVLKNVINAGSQVVAKQFGKDLFVFYYDSFNNAWKTAHWNGSWNGFNLDGGDNSKSNSSSSVGGQISIDIYNTNSLQIYYQDSANSVRHAWINK